MVGQLQAVLARLPALVRRVDSHRQVVEALALHLALALPRLAVRQLLRRLEPQRELVRPRVFAARSARPLLLQQALAQLLRLALLSSLQLV